MFYGALALLQAGLVVPLPSGGGGIEVAFLSGFAGDFPPGQTVILLLLWRFYTAILLTLLGVYLLSGHTAPRPPRSCSPSGGFGEGV